MGCRWPVIYASCYYYLVSDHIIIYSLPSIQSSPRYMNPFAAICSCEIDVGLELWIHGSDWIRLRAYNRLNKSIEVSSNLGHDRSWSGFMSCILRTGHIV